MCSITVHRPTGALDRLVHTRGTGLVPQDGRTEDGALSTTSQAAQEASAGLIAPPGYADGAWHRTHPFCFIPADGLKELWYHLSDQNQLFSPNTSSVSQKPYQTRVFLLRP